MKYDIEIDSSGNKFYYVNKILHRTNRPAIECADGAKIWHKDGKCHREGGPAIEDASGDKFWWINGELHREDSPASESFNGKKEWWLNDKEIGVNNDFTNESWKRFVKTLIFYKNMRNNGTR